MMMTLLKIAGSLVVTTSILFAAPSAAAGPYADSLGKCLVAGTTTAEKTTLVRWMFAMMALHPDVESGSTVTVAQRTALSKETAQLFQRLLTRACVAETREAVKYEGHATIESSFTLLGQVAARELFSHQRVAEGLSEFASHVDAKALEEVLGTPEAQ
jgi:hypothetical protein